MPTRRPVILDAFCGAGGAGAGYARAGFLVVGVDIEPQPRYPFPFVRADAVEYIRRYGHMFDAIHASPPCKTQTSLKAFSHAHHVNLIPDTRAALLAVGRPYVIENVPGADLVDPVTLCGSMFPELGVRRHRLFECSFPVTVPRCDHAGQAARSPGCMVQRSHTGKPVKHRSTVVGVYGRGQGLGPGEVDLWRKAMGIDWMTRDELSQAIPPAYTEHIGRQLMTAICATVGA